MEIFWNCTIQGGAISCDHLILTAILFSLEQNLTQSFCYSTYTQLPKLIPCQSSTSSAKVQSLHVLYLTDFHSFPSILIEFELATMNFRL